MLKEFREFIIRGNMVDMAVGIIIGAAFTAVVNSLVKDVIMPPIGRITGGVDFSDLFINMSPGEYASLEAAQAAGAATLNYGVFINTLVNLLIVGFAIFVLVKLVNNLRREEAAAPEPAVPPAPTRSDTLLEEIRDLLARR